MILMRQLTAQTNNTSNDALTRILEHQRQLLERLSAQSTGTPREPHVKLPIIKLPTFNGAIEEWKRYADTFKTLIHDSDLSNVQKHQYLIGLLSGAASRVIESIEISDQNYTVAWELLTKRYEDDKVIRKRHIQCLFEMPRMPRESAGAIRDLIDHVQKYLRVLQSMKSPTESWGELIIHLIEKNLDQATKRRWEEYAETLEGPRTDDILEFLQRRCQVLERIFLGEGGEIRSKNHNSDKVDGNKTQSYNSRVQGKTTLATTIQGRQCYYCQGQHLIYHCNKFLNLPVENRIEIVKQLKLCINCLRNDHVVARCKSSLCRKCEKAHNTLCHLNKEMANSRQEVSAIQGAPSDTLSGPAVHYMQGDTRRKRVLMSTAIVNVTGRNDYICQLRVLLDSASETNFITSAACKKLGLRLDNICESINGLNTMNCTIEHGCQLQVQSRTSEFAANLYCLVVPRITKQLPSCSIQVSQLPIPKNLKLADLLFYTPSNIDILIGSELFFRLLESEKIEIRDDLLTLQNSKFGWLIAGSVPEYLMSDHINNSSSFNGYTCLSIQQDSINDTLSGFWELEEYPIDQNIIMSTEEREAENQFVNTVSRDTSGRFVVRLPFRGNKGELGSSRDIALNRFKWLERKFQNNKLFHKRYSEFMREYVQLNHMSRVTENSSAITPIYLPHDGILRDSSITTKLRVVFDGSAKTASGVSLNETLMVGAKLQDNIIDIILRFLLHAIAITADLKKMYRQILIHNDDRDYQRILWRFSMDEPIQEFRLNTVTYGLACAPFSGAMR